LERFKSIYFPPIQYCWSSLGKDKARRGGSFGNRTLLADKTMASAADGNGKTGHITSHDKGKQTPTDPTGNQFHTPTALEAEPCGSSFVRNLPTKDLSPEVANIIAASWRPGTQQTYNKPIQRWLEFCGRRNVDPTLQM